MSIFKGFYPNCPPPLPVLKALVMHKVSPDNLELSGVVILPQEENTRLHSELIAGIAWKSKDITAR
jgi:hypothetical protein